MPFWEHSGESYSVCVNSVQAKELLSKERKQVLKRSIVLSLMLFTLVVCAASANAAVWYVDIDNLSGIEDGTSWQTAYTTIQPAIDAAYDAGGGDVWVAEGVYDEERTSPSPEGGDVFSQDTNTAAIVMKEGVELYAGFAGGETLRSQRDWKTNVATIDGSKARKGEPAVHVIYGADNSRLDGFVITGGIARDPQFHPVAANPMRNGGGMYNLECSPTVANCVFTRNAAHGGGGGMYNQKASPKLINCDFSFNRASQGGGAISNREGSPVVTECKFRYNADDYRMTVYNYHCNPVFANCLFAENSGAGMVNSSSSPNVVNCIFWANSALRLAGGMRNNSSSSSPIVTNCIFVANSPEQISNQSGNSSPSTPVLAYCIVQGGYEGEGNVDADPLFVDAKGGDFRLQLGSPALDSGTLVGAPSSDILGVPRPLGWGVDMGIFESPEGGTDTDGDFIPDILEQEDDPDGDGIGNAQDLDSDGDGILDQVEGIGDRDRDSIPNFLDLDSDGNGIPDEVEGAEDYDLDGALDFYDEDNDGDNRSDWYEGADDLDGDGAPNYMDTDSNGDGLPDSNEPAVIYVDKDNTSQDQDGLSWESALKTVQEGIDLAAKAGLDAEVWVAEGLYDEPRDDLLGSIIMRDNIHLYGGFAAGETERQQRNWQINQTTLDGSKARNGEPAQIVVIGADGIVLDGFHITSKDLVVISGLVDSVDRMGMYNIGISATIRNCSFRDILGRGLENSYSALVISNCLFVNNTDGGIGNYFGSMDISNCRFEGNRASNGYEISDGGGIFYRTPYYEGTLSISNCVFSGNVARSGGGIYIAQSSANYRIINCTFWRNVASAGGGALYYASSSGRITVFNSILWENTPEYSGGDHIALSNCIVTDPYFVRTVLPTPNLRLKSDSPCIDAGIADGAPATDITGTPRPQGNGIDMGAYEYLPDMDGDGIPDAVEGENDVDNDGISNNLDLDSDGDGILDFVEGEDDFDWDGVSNFLDLDSDGDGIVDSVEVADDPDGDGVPNYLDDDSDGDGISDLLEGAYDLDTDGILNYLDLDSDGDGIEDSLETEQDSDGDGISNFLDLDSDGDGLGDMVEGNEDWDTDGIPNFLDLDSNGDGILDGEDGTTGQELPVFFVDVDNISGIEDGLSWTTAFVELQKAIDLAAVQGGGEVWVAEGVYGEERISFVHPELVRTNTGSISMRQGVRLYGGFNGDESNRDERDWESNIVTLDGSVSRDGEAAYHVVVGANFAVLDGFVVTGGHADPDFHVEGDPLTMGAGLFNRYSALTIANCVFSGNETYNGGGIHSENSLLNITNCMFSENKAQYGAGISNSSGSSRITESTFSNNMSSYGGAIYNQHCSSFMKDNAFLNNTAGFGAAIYDDESSLIAQRCIFTGNKASSSGGGLANRNSSFAALIDCSFVNNSADDSYGGYGGAVFDYDNSEVVTNNCVFYLNKAWQGGAIYAAGLTAINSTFHKNEAGEDNGAVYCYGATTIANCILYGNTPNEVVYRSIEPAITFSLVQGGYEGTGNIDGDPLFADPEAGDFRLQAGSPCINTGTPKGAPSVDVEGVPRPQGWQVDMGAHEFLIEFIDEDGDYMPDDWEWVHGVDDADADPDGDGLSNRNEYRNGTDPNDADTDGDGMNDGDEVAIGADPIRPPKAPKVRVDGTTLDHRTGLSLDNVRVRLMHNKTRTLLASAMTYNEGIFALDSPNSETMLEIEFGAQGYDLKRFANFSAPVSLMTRLVPEEPAAPTRLTADSGAVDVLLRWRTNLEPDLAGYNVYRAVDGSEEFSRVNDSVVASARYRDAEVQGGTSYVYRVTALDVDGHESELSESADVLAGVVHLSLPDVGGAPGGVVRVTINVANATGIDPSGMELRLLYDASFIDFSVEKPAWVERTVLTSQVEFSYDVSEPGIVDITTTDGGESLDGEGHLFDVYLTLSAELSNDQCSVLSLDTAVLHGADPALLNVDHADTGTLCTSQICAMGDLNADGNVDSDDVLLALQIAVGLIEPDSCQESAGDLNGDGVIDSADALMIHRLATGLPINPTQPSEKAAKQSGPVTIEIPFVEATPGSNVSLPVLISNASGFAGVDLTVTYPFETAHLRLASVTPGPVLEGFEHEVNIGVGHVNISFSSPNPLGDTDGALAYLNFEVAATVPGQLTLPIAPNRLELKGAFGERIVSAQGIDKQSGGITVEGVEVIYADVNRDDAINAVDVQLVINAALGIDTAYNCDTNGDGLVNATDVQLVINAALGL